MLGVLIGLCLAMELPWPGWAQGASGRGWLAIQVFGLIGVGAAVYFGCALALGLGDLMPRRFLPKRWSALAQVAKADESAYDRP
jgi:hypothetical protein